MFKTQWFCELNLTMCKISLALCFPNWCHKNPFRIAPKFPLKVSTNSQNSPNSFLINSPKFSSNTPNSQSSLNNFPINSPTFSSNTQNSLISHMFLTHSLVIQCDSPPHMLVLSMYIYIYVEVSWNGGTPKSSTLVGFPWISPYKQTILGIPPGVAWSRGLGRGPQARPWHRKSRRGCTWRSPWCLGWFLRSGDVLVIYAGWWFGCHQFGIFPEILGMSSSQLTNSYFSEGWPNHQPVWDITDANHGAGIHRPT